MEKFIIRECAIEELEEVLLLQHQWVKEDITHGPIPVEKSYIETKLGKYFLVAELDSKILGFVYGSIHTADNMAVIDNGHLYIEVEDIYVSQYYRGTGLGSSLLDEILQIAKSNGTDRSLIY